MRRDLERVEIPDEHEARERSWRIVQTAFAERERVPRPSRRPWIAAGAVAFAAVVAALVSPPGRAVIDRVREVVGVERAQRALFALPAHGRVLVQSSGGPWVVSEDGSKRLLGRYGAASWSPFGRFVVAARKNELATLEPDGHVHWTLARPTVAFPRWGGTRTDTRIAYLSRRSLRIVAGDGTGDRSSCADAVARVAPAWRPGSGRILAFAAPNGAVYVYAVDTCKLLWHSRPGEVPSKLEWSSDGRLLLVLARPGLKVYDARGRVVGRDDPSDATYDTDAAFLPRNHAVVAVRVHGTQSDVFMLRTGRSLFHGTGVLGQLASSPDGRWLLVTWPTADQWIFVRTDGRGIRAVSNISSQFRSRWFPRVEGWVP